MGAAALAGTLALCIVAVGACSSSSSTSLAPGAACAMTPTQCPMGTTCWPADSVPNLKCLASDPNNGFGAMCNQQIGHPTCADGLACDQTSMAPGTCTYYCGPAGRGCPPTYDCRMTNVGGPNGPAIDICRPTGLVIDGGPVYEGGPGPDIDFCPITGDGGDGGPNMM